MKTLPALGAFLALLLLPCCGTVARTTAKVGTKTVGFAAKTTAKTTWGVAKTGGKIATGPMRNGSRGSINVSNSSDRGGYSYTVRGRRYHVMSASQARGYRETGEASYYGRGSGNKTASGERLNTRAFTAAHKTLPLGTRVRVTNLSNRRSVVVRINDRGPFIRGRIIDLTPAGADRLNYRRQGVTRVRVEAVR